VEITTPLTMAEIQPLERHFSMSSACGVCGRATLESLAHRGYRPFPAGPVVSSDVLVGLPDALRRAQAVFERTGGLHAAGLFTADGGVVAVREDVGRHNAMDKLTGWALMKGLLPADGHVLMVSGRSSYELVQKSLSIGAHILCSVSAPSSLAVDLAREFNLTLVGFLRQDRFTVYSAGHRVTLADERARLGPSSRLG
jgi:FdhD protein